MDAEEHKHAQAAPALAPWRRWLFAVVPAVGLLELGAHLVQARGAVKDDDWKRARDSVAAQVRPDDLVTFAPRWVDPIGRMQFGPQLATLEREARPDTTRFPRAFEVSVRGGHDPSLAGWPQGEERRFGDVTVRLLTNPAPAKVLDDLVSLVNPQRMQLARVEGQGPEVECPFIHAGTQSGGLGAGPAIPGDRFACPGGSFAGVSVAADLDYYPHRCIYAPPPGGKVSLRLRFLGVHLGQALHGHHGLYVEAERNKTGAPITLTFRSGGTVIGSVVHNDGEGWKPFEFDTSSLAQTSGGKADIEATLDAPNGDRRMYCFEADTR